MKAILWTKVTEVTDALAALCISGEILREAMLAGEFARDACTDNDPPSAAGFEAWAKTVRALREILMPRGWTRNDDANFSTVVSPDRKVAIAVATGDEGTGDWQSTPKTKYPKGPATAAAIHGNRVQLQLFEPDDPAAESIQDSNRQTWMLVRRRQGDFLFSELSLPAAIGEDGRVEGWAARIVLDPIKLESTVTRDSGDEGEPIVVDVRRRP